MDLDLLESSADFVFKYELNTNEGEEWGVMLKGSASKEYVDYLRRWDIKGIQKYSANRNEEIPDMSTEDGAEFFANEAADRQYDLVLRCTVGWYGVTAGGAELEFNEGNFKKLLNLKPGLVKLITVAIEDDANFMKAP